MKVLFVTPSFYPASYYGGPTFVNRSFCDSLALHDEVELTVLTTDADGPNRIDPHAPTTNRGKYEVTYCRRRLRPDIAPGLLLRLPGMIRQADLVHLNGVYSFTTIPALALCRLLRKPVLWSTHGALQRWSGSSRLRRKKLFERMCGAFCNRRRVVLHATSATEQAESVTRIRNIESTIVRYGTDLPEVTRNNRSGSGEMKLLFVGRLNPIKGIENLVQALTLTRAKAVLAICGGGDTSYQSQLRSLVRELSLENRVHFHGRVEGEAKEQRFREADICVVPSFKESFAAVIVESLARGVPVIASRGTPWEQVEQMGCGLWVSNTPAEIAKAIDRAATMPLSEMGARGRKWMECEFSWAKATGDMLAQYRALIDRCQPKPLKAVARAEAA